ncbi:Metallothionein [Macleaya cordata]|uniref:Metallothionein-like protein n=1 Tax=Macleaya cordata TaxID=56857 RepID=A0A200QLJ6_MACCD|nr:Metallothionein [Macleaya cordata]
MSCCGGNCGCGEGCTCGKRCGGGCKMYSGESTNTEALKIVGVPENTYFEGTDEMGVGAKEGGCK